MPHSEDQGEQLRKLICVSELDSFLPILLGELLKGICLMNCEYGGILRSFSDCLPLSNLCAFYVLIMFGFYI